MRNRDYKATGVDEVQSIVRDLAYEADKAAEALQILAHNNHVKRLVDNLRTRARAAHDIRWSYKRTTIVVPIKPELDLALRFVERYEHISELDNEEMADLHELAQLMRESMNGVGWPEAEGNQ